MLQVKHLVQALALRLGLDVQKDFGFVFDGRASAGLRLRITMKRG